MTKSRSNATAPNAKGTLVVGTGTDASTTLAVASTAGYLLTVDSGETTGLKWAAPAAGALIGCRLTNSADVAISNTTVTSLTFNTETYDTDAFHSTVTNTDRITIPSGKAGYYLINYNINWAANATGFRNCGIRLNGNSATINAVAYIKAFSDDDNSLAGTIVYYLNDADYLTLAIYQNSGGSLNAVLGRTYFEAIRIGS